MEYKFSTSNNSGKTFDIEFSASGIPKDVAEPIMSSIRRNIAKLEELNAPVEVVNKAAGPEEKVQAFKESAPIQEVEAFPEMYIPKGETKTFQDPILKR